MISQFCYCLLKSMFHSSKIETRIKRLHKRALRLVHDNSKKLPLINLLRKDKSLCKHQKRFSLLATESFKLIREWHLTWFQTPSSFSRSYTIFAKTTYCKGKANQQFTLVLKASPIYSLKFGNLHLFEKWNFFNSIETKCQKLD